MPIPIVLEMNLFGCIAVVAGVAGVGSYGIAALRIRRDTQEISKDSSNGESLTFKKVYEIVEKKIKNFKDGHCADREKQVEKFLTLYQEIYRSELSSTTEILRGEILSIHTALSDNHTRFENTMDETIKEIKIAIKNRG